MSKGCCCSCMSCSCLGQKKGVFCQLIVGLTLLSTCLVTWLEGFDSLIISQSNQKKVMTKSNYNLWGQIPGDSGSVIIRQFYLNTITNPREVLYQGHQAIVKEVGPFSYQEYQTFDQPIFNSNMTRVTFNFWLRYKYLPTTTTSSLDPLKTKVDSVNLGSMGAWYQLKNARDDQVAIQAFAQLIYGLEEQLYTSAIAQAISYQFIKEQDQMIEIMSRSGIEGQDRWQVMWNDHLFGWGQWKTFQNWVIAYQKQQQANKDNTQSQEALYLKDYFGLTIIQMEQLMKDQQMNNLIEMSKQLVNDQYCEGKTCNSTQLLAMQWTECELTQNTPAGIPQYNSVVYLNDSFIGGGYPEIKYFYDQYFVENISKDPKYKVKFDRYWASQLFNHSQTAEEYFTKEYYKNTMQILHPGNLKYFFKESEIFKQSGNENDLMNISNRFGLEGDLNKTRVFYEYVIYIVNEFAQKQSQFNGNKGIASMGTVGSQALYKVFQDLVDYLLPELVSALIYQQFNQKNYTCSNLLYQSIEGIEMEMADLICNNNVQFQSFNQQSIQFINDICEAQYSTIYNEFQQKNKDLLSPFQLMQLCDYKLESNRFNYQLFYQIAHSTLSSHYNCALSKCNKWEIGLLQWRSSSVTLNIPTLLSHNHKESFSVSSWNPSLFKQPFEYLAVMNLFRDLPMIDFDQEVKRYSQKDAIYLLTFERLFSPIVQSSVFLVDPSDFPSYFLQPNQQELQFYLRYIIIEIALEGITQRRTADELIWGYTDPFIVNLKSLDVQKGGDPSLNAIINLGGFNYTQKEAEQFPQTVNTGIHDLDHTRYYTKIYNRTHTSVQAVQFNGQSINTFYFNPWQKQVSLIGSDSFQNPPHHKQYIYITDLYRGAPMTDTQTYSDINGISVTVLQLDPVFLKIGNDYAPNQPFYMDKYEGLLNLTSVKTLPLFITQPYNMDLKKNKGLQEALFIDNNGQSISYNRKKDTIVVHMERYSGACLKAGLYLHTHYLMTNDMLFNYSFKGDALLPVFLLRRDGGFSMQSIQTQFGLIKVALTLRIVIIILTAILAAFYFTLFAFTAYNMHKRNHLDLHTPDISHHLLQEDSQLPK